MTPSVVQYLLMAAVGAGVGFLSGMFGIGGGVLAVPALVLLFGLSQYQAQGTSLAIIVVTAVAGVHRYSRFHSVDWRAALAFGLGSALVVSFGAMLAHRIPETWLRLMFAVFIAGVGAAMIPRADFKMFCPVLGVVLLVMGVRLLLH